MFGSNGLELGYTGRRTHRTGPQNGRVSGNAMHESIENNRDEIAGLCRRHHVTRLDVFGSAAKGGGFDPASSDVDFLVTFDRAAPGAMTLAAYLDFKTALEDLLDRPIDLVEASAVENPYMRDSIDRTREPVYAV